MQSTESKIFERIPFQQELNPSIHKIPCRVGAILCKTTPILKGSLVVSAGSANGTVRGSENPGGLLQSAKVEALAVDPSYPDGTLKNLTNVSILRRRIFDAGRFLADQSLGITGFNGAAATYTLNQPFPLYWEIPWLKRPYDGALDTTFYGEIKLTLLNGSRDLQFSGNDRTFNYAGVSWDIYHKFDRYDPGAGLGPTVVFYDDDHQINIQSASTRLEINKSLPSGGLYTDILWIARTTNNALADTIINRITMDSGTENFYDRYSDSIKDEQEDLIVDASTTSTPRTGLYNAHCILDGMLSGAKPNVSAVLDVSNPGTDNIVAARRAFVPIPDKFKKTA